jgi:hypothetical protein
MREVMREVMRGRILTKKVMRGGAASCKKSCALTPSARKSCAKSCAMAVWCQKSCAEAPSHGMNSRMHSRMTFRAEGGVAHDFLNIWAIICRGGRWSHPPRLRPAPTATRSACQNGPRMTSRMTFRAGGGVAHDFSMCLDNNLPGGSVVPPASGQQRQDMLPQTARA